MVFGATVSLLGILLQHIGLFFLLRVQNDTCFIMFAIQLPVVAGCIISRCRPYAPSDDVRKARRLGLSPKFLRCAFGWWVMLGGLTLI